MIMVYALLTITATYLTTAASPPHPTPTHKNYLHLLMATVIHTNIKI